MEDSDSHVVQRALDIQDSMTSMVNKVNVDRMGIVGGTPFLMLDGLQLSQAFHTKTAEVLRRIREKDPKFDIFQVRL